MSRQEKLAALASTGVTKAELDNIDGGTARGTTAIADGDGVLINDAGTMRMTSVETMATYMGTKITSGSLVYIASSGALSAAGDVAFTQFDSSKYDSYEFNLLNVKPSDNVPLVAEASTNGGSSYDTTSGNYHDAPSTDRANFAVTLLTSDVGNGTNQYGASGRFLIHNPASSAYTYTQFLGLSMNQSGGLESGASNHNNTSLYLNTAEVNAIKFKFTSGNIASGEIVMYGIANGT